MSARIFCTKAHHLVEPLLVRHVPPYSLAGCTSGGAVASLVVAFLDDGAPNDSR
jgi:hypothetical protein